MVSGQTCRTINPRGNTLIRVWWCLFRGVPSGGGYCPWFSVIPSKVSCYWHVYYMPITCTVRIKYYCYIQLKCAELLVLAQRSVCVNRPLRASTSSTFDKDVYLTIYYLTTTIRTIARVIAASDLHFSFCERVINAWNNLSPNIVDFSSITRFRCFRNHVDFSTFLKRFWLHFISYIFLQRVPKK